MMSARIRIAGLALVALIAALTPGYGAAQEAKPKPAEKKAQAALDIFRDPKVWQVHLTIPAKEYAAMQPIGGRGGFGGFPGAPMPPAAKPVDGREVHRNNFGVDLPWAYGSLAIDGVELAKVGVRYKGNGTIMDAGNTIKKSFKIDIDKYNDNLRYHNLKSVNLHCEVADPSKARETLAYAAYRAAGVPASRTTYAEVTLTVPEKYDREYLGLYTIVEPVDKKFLAKHYKSDKGLLMKPERAQGLGHFGDDWQRYKTAYVPKRDATPDEAKRMIAFTRLVNLENDEQFKKEIETYLDVDAFLRYMAVTGFVVNLDSFFTIGHNYYLYLEPTTNKFHFLPWDLDRSFANFGIFGSAEQQMDLSITKPYGQSRLPDRLFGIKEYKDRYQQILKEAAATFTRDSLLKQLDAFEAMTKDIVAKGAKATADRKEPPGGGGMFGRIPDLRTFADARTKSIDAQIAGKSQGFSPTMGFGGPMGGGGFGPPGGGGFGPGNQLAKPLLEYLDGDKNGKVSETEFASGMKKLFGEWDKDKSGSLDQREIAEGVQRLTPMPAFGGGFVPGGPGGPGGPPGKGPGGNPDPRPKGP